MPKLAPEALERAAGAILEAVDVPRDDAQIVSRHLVEANLAGHDSHGVLRVPQYVKAVQTAQVKLGVKPQVLNDTATTASLDGQNGFGQVAAQYAMSVAISKARQSGIAAATVRNGIILDESRAIQIGRAD